MIIYVNLEHQSLKNNREVWKKQRIKTEIAKHRIEELSGLPCTQIHYPQAVPQLLKQLKTRAVIISGNLTDWKYYAESDLMGLRQIVLQGHWPVLSFCGGYQLLAQTYGGEIGPIGAEAKEESTQETGTWATHLRKYNAPMVEADAWPGMKQECGFLPVQITQNHTLLENLGPSFLVFQQHYWEVKHIPPDFTVIASSDLCPIQAIAHKTRLIFGTQFHPEQYNLLHPDGQKILINFFAIVHSVQQAITQPQITEETMISQPSPTIL